MHDSSEDHSNDICSLVGSGLFVRPLIIGILGGCKANDGGVFAVIYVVGRSWRAKSYPMR